MAAIITLALVGVWGAILYATFGPDINKGNPAKVRPERWMMIDEDQAAQLAHVLHPMEETYDAPVPEGTELLGDRIADNADNIADELTLDPEVEEMLREFSALADNAQPLEELAPRIAGLIALDPSAITVQQIVTAARQGRLRIISEERDPAVTLASAPISADAWVTHASIPDAPEFVRDYAKPAPGAEDRAPTRSDDPRPLVRLDVALTQASDEPSRDRDAARILNAVVTQLTAATDDLPADFVRFEITETPIQGDQSAAPAEEWRALLPNNAVIFSVFFERAEADPQD